MAHKSKKSSKVEDDKGKASVKKTVEFKIFDVKEKQQLKTLLEKNKIKLEKGRAYFELTKSETVQDYKQLVVMKKADQSFITGDAVRFALEIPEETVNKFELDLETVPDFAVFVQSTSYNRNVLPNTRILYDMREDGMDEVLGDSPAGASASIAMAESESKPSQVDDDNGKASVEFKIFDVKEKQQLKTLLEKNKIKLEKGRAYFELTKSETVQDYKQLVVMKKADQSFIAGYAVRYALKIPEETDNEFELDLETVPDFAVFVQSTSYNRNVLPNTRILYDMREAGMGKGMGEAGAEDAAAAAALAETARALRLVAEQFGSVGPGATDAELQEVLDDLRAMGVSKPALPPSVAALWRAAGFFHFTQDPDSHWGFNICGARQAVDITDGFASNRIDWCKWALEEGRLFSVGDPGWLYIASSMCDMYVSWFCCFDSESPHFGKVHTISTHDGELGWDADDMMVYAERILNWYRQGWKRRALMDCVWGRRYDENNAQYETSDDGSYGNSDDNEDGEE